MSQKNNNLSNLKGKNYIDSPEKLQKIYKRSLIIVVISQIFSGAGLAAGIAVGALLAKQMLGTDSFAGVPIALFTLGSALAAFLIGRISERSGRRLGLTLGFLVGGIGAIGVVLAAIMNSIVLLFISLIIYGSGSATNMLARYAGTDLADVKQRGKAISIAMVSTTFGAVAGPNMVEFMGRVAKAIDLPPLSGPFLMAAVAYILASVLILVFLRPDPLLIAKEIQRVTNNARGKIEEDNSTTLEKNNRGLIAAATLMVLTQLVMYAIMTMTPVHMGYHGHGLREVGMIIGFHIAAMFLPSPLTGILVDKFGRFVMSVASGITLLIAGILAAFAPGDSTLLLTIALALLGLGWNFGFITGTAMLVDSTNINNRAKIQGTIDVTVALSGATGGALSGIVVAYSSYALLSVVGGILALLLIPVIIWSNK